MSHPRILIAPLDWGLGHASRCIPIVNKLLEKGVTIAFAGDGNSLNLLQKEFPEIPSFHLPAYPITYPSKGSFALHFLLQYPHLIKFYRKEHREFIRLVDVQGFDVVISDNRYGCYDPRIKSILITHQLTLPSGWIYRFAQPMINRMLLHFNEVWVPDYPNHALAGNLSTGKSLYNKVKYIGSISRFKPKELAASFDCLGITSGPEPHRAMFVKELIAAFAKMPGRHQIVAGNNQNLTDFDLHSNVQLHGLVDATTLHSLIASSKYVIARCGYSTIMDLTAMKRKAILIPTPGQSEQEYLATYHQNKDRFIIRTGPLNNLGEALQALDRLNPKFPDFSESALDQAIDRLLL